MKRQYTLHFSEDQAQILIEALDFFSRIPMGQLSEIHNWVHPDLHDAYCASGRQNEIDMLLIQVKHALFPDLPPGNTYHGIHSNKLGNKYRIAYDLQQVIRHRVAHDRDPGDSWNVWKNEPHQSSTHKLAVIESKDLKKEDDVIWQYLEHLSSKGVGPTWTEREWQHANEMRIQYELYRGYTTLEEVYGEGQPEQP